MLNLANYTSLHNFLIENDNCYHKINSYKTIP